MNEINIVALEIGSSKIKGAVGSIDDTGVLTVKAVDEEPITDWVRYGIVSNAEEVANHATLLLERLENRCGGRFTTGVYVSIGGRSFRSEPRECERLLPNEMEISADIIEQLIAETLNTANPRREVLSVVPREFIVDKRRVNKPIGSLGQQIKMLSNIITCRPQIKRNLQHLLTEKLGLNVNGHVIRQISQADFTLNPEEKRLGCMLVDCGAETTTVSIYKHGYLQYLATLPMGSRNITRDLTHLNILEERAEEIKHQYGNNASLSLPGVNSADVNKFISYRAGEIIANINNQIQLAGLQPSALPMGIILVGRGSRLVGFSERLANKTGLKVRFGNAARTDLRLADPRISISDSLDVIATLYDAAHHNPVDCFSAEPETPEVEEVVETVVETPVPEIEPEPDPIIKPADPKPRRPKGKGSWITRGWERFTEMLEAPEDDDDAVMQEDNDD